MPAGVLPFPLFPLLFTRDSHFAAGMTPHPRDLPIRRALMYSDWEQRSEIGTGVTENVDADKMGGHRRLVLREPLTQFTTGIVSASVVNAPFD